MQKPFTSNHILVPSYWLQTITDLKTFVAKLQRVNLYLSKKEYWDSVVWDHGTLKGQGCRQALRECP